MYHVGSLHGPFERGGRPIHSSAGRARLVSWAAAISVAVVAVVRTHQCASVVLETLSVLPVHEAAAHRPD